MSDDYISSARADFFEAEKAYAQPNGVDESVYKDIFTYSSFKSCISNYFIKTVNNGAQYDISSDTKSMRDALTKALEDSYTKDGIEITPSVKTDIDSFTAQTFVIFSKVITVKYIEKYAQICTAYSRGAAICTFAVLIVACMLIWALFRLSGMRHHAMNYLIYALSSSAILTAVPAVWGGCTKIWQHITLTPDYVFNAVSGEIRSLFISFGISAAVFAVFAVICFLIEESLRKDELSQLKK